MKTIIYKIIACTALVSTTTLVSATGYIEPRAARAIHMAERRQSMPSLHSTGDTAEYKYIPMIVEIADGEDGDAMMSELGAVVFGRRANLYLVSVPADRVTDLPRFRSIDGLHVYQQIEPSVNLSRTLSAVDEVHSGTTDFGPYTGRGVVTGICDVGFDPRHGAFKDRLDHWTHFEEFEGVSNTYSDITTAPATDNDDLSHATHVGNILAGCDGVSPFYGVATGSTFISTTSSLTDVGILAGIEDVIAFAKSVGQPAVVNISAGSYLGPHDGCDLVGRYLTELSKDAVICFSAGNYGKRQNCLTLDLDNYSEPVGSSFCGSDWTGFEVVGGSDLWSSDDKPFEVRIRVRDMEKRQDIYVSDWIGGTRESGETEIDLTRLDVFDPESYVWLGWGVNPHNNRFSIVMDYDYSSQACEGDHPWARYFVCFQVRAVEPATHVMAYADGVRSFFHANGGMAGNPDGSISNLASCPDVVAVGGWHSRSVVPDVVSGSVDWGLDVNCIGPWSSWGTSGDGRPLPHFAAPGNVIVSALSAPYFAKHPDEQRVCFDAGGHRFYAEGGTSMASPFTAGVFALWLEADPTLTVYELRDIAMATANRNFADIADPRWGAGAIDARAGLAEVERRKVEEGVGNVTVDATVRPHVTVNAGRVSVVWTGVDNPLVDVYTLTGVKVSADALAPGTAYVVTVTDTRTARSHSVKKKIPDRSAKL